MKYRFLLLIFLLVFFTSCSTKIITTTYQERPEITYPDQIPFFTLTDDLPVGAQIIGKMNFRGNLDRECTTENLIQDISNKAKQSGANAVKITNYIPNNDLCPDIVAHLVYLENVDDYQNKNYQIIDEPEKAIVHFYRRSVADLFTQFKPYKVLINNDVSVELRNKSKVTILANPGAYTFTLEDENYGINKQLEAGKTYFVRVSVGDLYYSKPDFNQPKINLIDPLVGIVEFESFNNRKARSYEYKNPMNYDQGSIVANEELQNQIAAMFTTSNNEYLYFRENKKNIDIISDEKENNNGYQNIGKTNIEDNPEDNIENTFFTFFQFYLAYNSSSFDFRDGYVNSTPPDFPSIETEFETTSTKYGIDIGFATGKEEFFLYMDIWFLSSQRMNRGADYVLGAGIGFGGRYKITPEKNHFLGWGLAFGANDLNRGLYNEGNIEAVLSARKWVLNPQIRYEYLIPTTKISIYSQLRYVQAFGRSTFGSGVFYTESDLGRHEDETETTRYKYGSPYLQTDANGRLNYGSRLDISFGIIFNL